MKRTSISLRDEIRVKLSRLKGDLKKINNLEEEPSSSVTISAIIQLVAEKPDLRNELFNNVTKVQTQDGRRNDPKKNPFTYLIFDKEEKLHKIGESFNPNQRLDDLQKTYNESLGIVAISSFSIERKLQKKYQKFSSPRESDKDGSSEWFCFPENILSSVIKDFSQEV